RAGRLIARLADARAGHDDRADLGHFLADRLRHDRRGRHEAQRSSPDYCRCEQLLAHKSLFQKRPPLKNARPLLLKVLPQPGPLPYVTIVDVSLAIAI